MYHDDAGSPNCGRGRPASLRATATGMDSPQMMSAGRFRETRGGSGISAWAARASIRRRRRDNESPMVDLGDRVLRDHPRVVGGTVLV